MFPGSQDAGSHSNEIGTFPGEVFLGVQKLQNRLEESSRAPPIDIWYL